MHAHREMEFDLEQIIDLFAHFLHTFIFFFLQQNNLDYVDPQIANLLFEAGQSSTNISYNI